MKKIAFNDAWTCNSEAVTLPHDAQIKEKRSKATSSGGHGYFPGGKYTYEKPHVSGRERLCLSSLRACTRTPLYP